MVRAVFHCATWTCNGSYNLVCSGVLLYKTLHNYYNILCNSQNQGDMLSGKYQDLPYFQQPLSNLCYTLSFCYNNFGYCTASYITENVFCATCLKMTL